MGLCTHSSVGKVSSALHSVNVQFCLFFCFGEGGEGGKVHVSGGRGLHGVSEGGGVI